MAAVVRDGLSLEAALAGAPSQPPRDLALTRALASGTLRWHHRLRWQAEQLLSRPVPPRDAELGALIAVGLFQLQWLRVPDHAAVSATVAAARLLGFGRAAGLVNAVLRRFQRERPALERRLLDRPEALFSHPDWLIRAMQHDWPNEWRAILEENNEFPPMWLRINARRTTRSEYLDHLRNAGIEGTLPAEPLPAAILLREPVPSGSLPGFEAGLVSVQDAAAQLAAGFLAPAPGERVLDACAAPGGKTAHILESGPDLGEVWALDRDPQRLAVAAANLRRLGLAAVLCEGDAGEPQGWWDGHRFGRILLDAPCSAVGVIRRHPDIKVLRRADDVARNVVEQARMLRALWPLLSPGGRLLYATCSVLKAENHGQVANFLAETPDARLVGPGEDGHYQRLPGEANADGFYYACLGKQDIT